MARRAGLFKHYREVGKNFLVIAGPYEFLADDPFTYGSYAPDRAKNSLPAPEYARLALSVHNLLRVNCGWLSHKAGDWLHKATGSLPLGFRVVGSEPLVQILDTASGKIGVVLFPEGRKPGSAPDAATVQKTLAAGKTLAGKVRLVIGVSPWGYKAERDFLKKAEGVYGCILGGGEGIGFDFFLRETPKVLWIRPDSQGRGVNILELLTLPGLGEAPRWKQNSTFRAYLEFLDDQFPADPAMLQLVGPPPR